MSQDRALVCSCDRDRITQVIINLVMNAIKFTPEGGSVEVDLRRSQEEPQEALFRVSDTGPGISKEESEALFDRFKQLPTVSKAKGTGLGLAISKAIIQMHGGRIWVESEIGQGASFKFTLRLADNPTG